MLILDSLLIGGIKFVLDKVASAVDEETNDETSLREELLAAQMRVELGEMDEEDFVDLERQILARLRDVSVASRVNRAIGDKMIMNAAFLVQRDQENAFDRRIKEIASHYDKLTFKYTGPWPPYNFVNIRLKLERAGQH